MLPENWVHLSAGAELIDTTKPSIGRSKNLLLLAASKQNTRDLFQSSIFPNSEIEEVLRSFKRRVSLHLQRGLSRGEFNMEYGAEADRGHALVG